MSSHVQFCEVRMGLPHLKNVSGAHDDQRAMVHVRKF